MSKLIVNEIEKHDGSQLTITTGTDVSMGGALTVSGNLAVDTNTLYVDAANNRVRIGTGSSAYKLQISNSGNKLLQLNGFDTTGASDTGFTISADNSKNIYLYQRENAAAVFGTNNSEAMRIDSSGNVGIGGSPTYKLDVFDVDPVVRVSATNASGTSRLELRGLGSNGTSNAISRITAIPEGSGTASALQIQTRDSGGTISEAMRIDSDGRVGIGVTPSTIWSSSYDALQIGLGGSIYAHSSAGNALKIGSNVVYEGTAPNYYDKYLSNSFATKYEQDDGKHIWSVAASGTAGNAITWSEAMRIDSSGNVGIGTSSPSVILTVDSGSSGNLADFNSTNANGGYVRFLTSGTTFGDIGTAAQLVSGSASDLALNVRGSNNICFGVNFSEKMRIDSSGNVGIGTTPSSILHTVGVGGAGSSPIIEASTTTNYVGLKIKQNGDFWIAKDNSTGSSFSAAPYANVLYGSGAHPMVFSTNATERMRITSGGEVLIGTQSTPNGTSDYGSSFSAESYNRMVLRLATSSINQYSVARFYNPNGQVGEIKTQNSSTLYVTSSDYRLKENVVEMTGALDRVDALKPSRFNFIADPETTVDGFLAHEVQAIVPEAVTGEKDAVDEEGNPMGTRPIKVLTKVKSFLY